MTSFVHSAAPEVVYRDDDGAVIDYGNRWPDSPADDSYSRVSHPERFAHLHVFAQELIDWLVTEFECEATETGPTALGATRRVIRTVTITPKNHAAGALRVGFTDYPGLVVWFGRNVEMPVPVCGCDACDDTAVDLEEQLENYVLGFIDGGLRESSDGSLFWLEGAHGGTGSGYGGDLRFRYEAWSRRVGE